jgi:2-(3-amino-3-carboxypropyl)histidine synthase
VAMGYVKGWWEKDSGICGTSGCAGCSCGDANPEEYTMDYYSQDGGKWNSCYMKKKTSAGERNRTVERIGKLIPVRCHL